MKRKNAPAGAPRKILTDSFRFRASPPYNHFKSMATVKTKIKIAVTGISSFTGMWIAKTLADQGYSVDGLLTQSRSKYSGLKEIRLKRLEGAVDFHPNITAENGSMVQWIQENKPEIWIHHHHFMSDFRSPNYDFKAAESTCVEPLPDIVKSLRSCGCKSVIVSGSYLEPGEGAVHSSYRPTPYALSKMEVWKKFLELVGPTEMNLVKIVIPNPIGPFENEDRLIPDLLRKSVSRIPLKIKSANVEADNIPVSFLAQTYALAVERALGSHHRADKKNVGESVPVTNTPEIFRPSLGRENNRHLVERVCRELIGKRMGLNAPVLEWGTHSETTAGAFENRSKVPGDTGFEDPWLSNPNLPEWLKEKGHSGFWAKFWDFYAYELTASKYFPK